MNNKQTEQKTISLAHGNGGKLSQKLIKSVFVSRLDNRYLAQMLDGAILPADRRRICFTTDSYVVRPWHFPGGDIGRLAISGTVNDLAVCGAEPKFIAAGFIIEEGFLEKDLKKIVASIQKTAAETGVEVVTGDTKVVEKGSADGIFITTSGIGFLDDRFHFSPLCVEPGDRIILSGTIGDHAVAIMRARGDFPITLSVESDVAPLWPLVARIYQTIDPKKIRLLRDPTRGGLATTLNEFAAASKFSIELDEEKIPVSDQVKAVCELTGFDPLYLANEGKVVVVCAPDVADEILDLMAIQPIGKNAAIIGTVTEDPLCRVYSATKAGGSRIIDTLTHDMLPRIC